MNGRDGELVGRLCRAKAPLIRMQDEEQGRLCKVVGEVPEPRWRTPRVPEYKVEMLAMPVTAHLRESDFDLI